MKRVFDHYGIFCDTDTMKSFLRKHYLVIIAILVGLVFLGIGFEAGKYTERKVRYTPENHNSLDMTPFWAALDALDKKFVPTGKTTTLPTDEEKVYGAIQGLATSFGDPYTMFFPPQEAERFKADVSGEFGGVGMEIGIKEGNLVVIAPLKNTPAERAGIKAGDKILKIDNEPTDGMTTETAVLKIRGKKGTTVVLTIERSDSGVRDISVTRDTIVVPTIDTELREDGIFVVSLHNFSANASNDFRNALREFILSGSDKLILDLRNNPGGYLELAIDMASFFLPVGKAVVIEDRGPHTSQEILRSKGYDIFNKNLKMVVLINGGSASASEILAGALRDHGIAHVVGKKSFGKGSVQELINLTPDTSLKITIARWLTPNGISISEEGITPDEIVDLTEADFKEERDPQLLKAVTMLLDPSFTHPL